MTRRIIPSLSALLIVFTLASSLHFSSPFTGGFIDISNPYNYANQVVPNYIDDDNTPNNNPITDMGATLGRVLFYDKKLSSNQTVACASCHRQEHAFSDLDQASTGVNGLTGRHSMRLINSRFADEERFFWDERASTLELQTTQPIRDHAEMGFSGAEGDPNFSELITRLENTDYYPTLFAEVYGDPTITEVRMQLALAQFIRSIQSFDSKYDVGRTQVNNNNDDFPNFTPQENQGKQLFSQNARFNNAGQRIGGGLGCQRCHQAPEFDIDPSRGGNNNIGNNGMVTGLDGIDDFNNTRSPTLRDFVKPDGSSNGDAFHNGQAGGMMAMIEHYNSGIQNVPNLDPRLRPNGNPQRLNMTAAERTALVAFLRTLGGSDVYTNEKWSNPFDENDEIRLVDDALPLATIFWEGEAVDDHNVFDYQLSLTATLVGLTIERSSDTIEFEEVDELEYEPQSESLTGQWIDETPLTAAYYRLVLTFEDGQVSTSPLIYLENNLVSTETMSEVTQLRVYPNPVRDVLFIEMPTETWGLVEIYDLQGRLVQQYESQSSISVATLPTGTYIVKIGDWVQRIVKSN
ncbi:MAG: cytochrome c peroxidase [Bacteroidota bacterium]